MIPLDTDYMDARPAAKAMKAIALETTREIFPEICTGPKLGPWEPTPRGDCTYGVRRIAAGLTLLSGHFASEQEARDEADALNRALLKGDA